MHTYTQVNVNHISLKRKCLFECFAFRNQLGHSFKRTSTTIYANTGASIEAIKRHTGHKSTKVCEGYIADSIGYKKNAADAIASSINFGASSSTASSTQSAIGSLPSILGAGQLEIDVSMEHSSDIAESLANERDCPVNQVKEVVTNSEMEIHNSQTINLSSSQNFLAQMDKRIAFYKCENITINFK